MKGNHSERRKSRGWRAKTRERTENQLSDRIKRLWRLIRPPTRRCGNFFRSRWSLDVCLITKLLFVCRRHTWSVTEARETSHSAINKTFSVKVLPAPSRRLCRHVGGAFQKLISFINIRNLCFAGNARFKRFLMKDVQRHSNLLSHSAQQQWSLCGDKWVRKELRSCFTNSCRKRNLSKPDF